MSILRAIGTLSIFVMAASAGEAHATAKERPNPYQQRQRMVGGRQQLQQRGRVSMRPMRQQNNTVLQNPRHQQLVQRRLAELTEYVLDGHPMTNEQGQPISFFHAAFAEVIEAPGTTMTLIGGQAGDGAKYQVSTTDGIWRGHLLGVTSTHDLVPGTANPTQADWAAMEQRTEARIAQDYIRVSMDHGPGTARTVLANQVKSNAANAIPLEVPLNKGGVTRLIYERTNASGGVVGGEGGYAGGRIIELHSQ